MGGHSQGAGDQWMQNQRGHIRAKGVGLGQMDYTGFLLKAGQREKISRVSRYQG